MIFIKRYFYKYLLNWKNESHRKPILLQGARQVGKTFLLKHFAKKEFTNFVYINFEKDMDLAKSLENITNPETIIEYLSIYTNKPIDMGNTLIIFDEVQNYTRILNSLKYFNEDFPNSYIIATGSLLGVSLANNNEGFPVGKVDIQHLYPLTFFEFLEGLNEISLLNFLYKKENFEPLPIIFHNRLIELLKLYFIIGGMPEALVTYLQSNGDWEIIRKIQNDIISAYIIDSVRYANKTESIKIREVWDSIPQQISNENKRFKLSEIKKNASLREYRNALNWLIQAGILFKIEKIKKVELPLSAYRDEHLFKIFLLDVGLLSAILDLSPKIFLNTNELFLRYKGAFTENFIAQELTACLHKKLYYWANNTSEVDFIISFNDYIIPIEIKSGFNTKSKSLKVYIEKNNPKYAIRSSLRNFNKNNTLYDIPLYSISLFPKLIFNSR